MPWFKVDDQLFAHPKWVGAPLRARGLWVTAGSWAASQPDDGFVPAHMLSMFGATKKDAGELVRRGLWHEAEDGWRFVDRTPGSARILFTVTAGDLRTPIPKWMRDQVLDRDGLTCGLCGGDVEAGDVHMDHILPVTRGGKNRVTNLQVTHSRCNIRKGNRI